MSVKVTFRMQDAHHRLMEESNMSVSEFIHNAISAYINSEQSQKYYAEKQMVKMNEEKAFTEPLVKKLVKNVVYWKNLRDYEAIVGTV